MSSRGRRCGGPSPSRTDAGAVGRASLGPNPRSWLLAAVDEGEEEVAGVTTRHVSGRLNVAALMRDLNRFARRSGPAVEGGAGEEPPEPLSRDDMRELPRWWRIRPSTSTGVEDDLIRGSRAGSS